MSRLTIFMDHCFLTINKLFKNKNLKISNILENFNVWFSPRRIRATQVTASRLSLSSSTKNTDDTSKATSFLEESSFEQQHCEPSLDKLLLDDQLFLNDKRFTRASLDSSTMSVDGMQQLQLMLRMFKFWTMFDSRFVDGFKNGPKLGLFQKNESLLMAGDIIIWKNSLFSIILPRLYVRENSGFQIMSGTCLKNAYLAFFCESVSSDLAWICLK